MSFYRKYRPQLFEEVDSEIVRQRLTALLSKNKKDFPHAYLFTGPKGSGKTTAARLLAKLFNCSRAQKSGAPCGKCPECRAIAEGRFLDVLELDAASNRGIDEIRQLRDTIALAPTAGAYKVYIIDEVHMLTTEAFNALLKTLEEPPLHSIFILATTDPQKVPATIKSRCVHLGFTQASETELLHALSRIVKEEHIEIDAQALALVGRSAEGSFRDAVKLLEQVSFHQGKITKEIVERLLSTSEEKAIATFLEHLSAYETRECLYDIGELVKTGKDIKTFLTDILSRLEQYLVSFAQGERVEGWTGESVSRAIRKLTQAWGELKISPIIQLPIELAVFEFCEEHGTTRKEEARLPAGRQGTDAEPSEINDRVNPHSTSAGLLTLDKLTQHWKEVIEEIKPYNHSVAGVLRSARPRAVENGILTIEAFYKFHEEKLTEVKNRELISGILKKLFGEKIKVNVVLGKK